MFQLFRRRRVGGSGGARPLAGALLAAGALAAPGAGLAHDFYLMPAGAMARPGEEMAIAMHVSDVFPGQPTAWRVGRIREFFLFDERGRRDLMDAPIEGDPARARIRLRSRGTTVVALVTDATYIEIEPEHFEEYLRLEGHEEILARRSTDGTSAAAGRERYTRYVKTLVDTGGSSKAALRPVGLKIEIVPEAEPGAVRPGADLPVRVLFDGRPYGGGYLCATHAGYSEEHDAYAWCGRLDGEGRARAPIRAAGWQILRITRMAPRGGDPKADWESFWAALTFQVPREAAP